MAAIIPPNNPIRTAHKIVCPYGIKRRSDTRLGAFKKDGIENLFITLAITSCLKKAKGKNYSKQTQVFFAVTYLLRRLFPGSLFYRQKNND